MSTLSQFLPQGDSFVGEFIPGITGAWGLNPSFGTREYLQSGNTKTYSANYATLALNFPALAANSPVASTVSSWNADYLMYSDRVFSLGGNVHRIPIGFSSNGSTPLQLAAWGTNTASAATTQTLYGDNGANPPFISGAVLFNGAIIVIGGGVLSPWGYPARTIWRSTGTTYSSVFSVPTTQPYALAASPTLCVAIGLDDTNSAGTLLTSTNGTSWTSSQPFTNFGSNVRRFFYSQAAGCFVILNQSGQIWTSTDCLTWTARTAPSGMVNPGGTGYGSLNDYRQTMQYNNYAGTSSETLCVLAQDNTSGLNTKLLKVTAGPTFSIVNLSNSPSIAGLITTTASTANLPLLTHDGTRYVMVRVSSNYAAYSNDGGNTWLLDHSKLQTDNTSFPNVGSINAAGGNLYVSFLSNGTTISANMVGARMFDFGTRYALQTPQLVGTSVSGSFGTNTSAYVRIK